MLEWKEIKGYNKNLDYKYQKENGIDLPELNEEILICFLNDTHPKRPPFVGYFKHNDIIGGIWMMVSVDGGSLYEIQDGVKWARFNRSRKWISLVDIIGICNLLEYLTCKMN